MGQNFIRKISNSMKIELTRSECIWIFNLLTEKCEDIKSDISDMEGEINRLVNLPKQQQTFKDAVIESSLKAKELKILINKIGKQIK
jgi:hypothetical protein